MNAVVATQDQLPAAQTQQAAPIIPSSPAEAHYLLRRRQAVDYAKSSLVPDQYRNNPANVMIAMEIADRIGASHLAVMQQLYVVKGKPSFSSQFLIASVNASGRFTPIRFEIKGDDPKKDDYRVRAHATDLKTGDECKGTWITWDMVKGEKWGDKWKTMPEQMFMYRAATFWARLYAPEKTMGMLSREEMEDMGVIDAHASSVQRGDLKSLEAKLLGNEPVTDADMQPPPPHDADGELLTVASVIERIQSAASRDELDDVYDLSRQLDASDDDRKAMFQAYEARADQLEQ